MQMHYDVTRTERQYGSSVVVTLKSKMKAGSAWPCSEIRDQFYLTYLIVQTSRPSRYSTTRPHQNPCQHYPPWENTTPHWIRSCLQLPQCMFEPRKRCFNLFDVIVHKVCFIRQSSENRSVIVISHPPVLFIILIALSVQVTLKLSYD